jgi:hypothetical protein
MITIKKRQNNIQRDSKNFALTYTWIGLLIIGIGAFVNSIFLDLQGIGVLLRSIDLNIRIGIILVIFSILIFLVRNKQQSIKESRDFYVMLVTVFWILLVFLLTISASLEIFIILLLVGFLLLTEATEEYLSYYYARGMTYLLTTFIILFVIILGKTIISI